MIVRKVGNLSLGYKTFLIGMKFKEKKLDSREGTIEDGLEICQWDPEGTTRWTIASFEYNKHEPCWELSEVGDRLTYEDINPEDFFYLIKLGHMMLENVEGTKKDE